MVICCIVLSPASLASTPCCALLKGLIISTDEVKLIQGSIYKLECFQKKKCSRQKEKKKKNVDVIFLCFL